MHAEAEGYKPSALVTVVVADGQQNAPVVVNFELEPAGVMPARTLRWWEAWSWQIFAAALAFPLIITAVIGCRRFKEQQCCRHVV